MRLFFKEIKIVKPDPPRYPEDKNNRICIVVFHNGFTWAPSFSSLEELNEKIKECYNHNLKNDNQGRQFNEGSH